MMQAPVSAAEVVNDFLTAFYSADFVAAQSLVADDFAFRGPFLQVDSKQDFFDGAEGLRPIVRGHRVLRQWHDADEVCSMYEVQLESPATSGSILMSEWNTVR